MSTMDIVLIVCGGIFAFLLLLYAVVAIIRKNKNNKETAELDKVYSSDKLSKMEYDLASYDEETYKLLNVNKIATQMTVDDIIGDGFETPAAMPATIDETLFDKIESDGLEELTGNYKKDGE